jgi:hypothetical protein
MTSIIPTSRVTVPENVLVQELDGEAVLLDLKSETYFGLDDVGIRMWQVLTTSASIQNAYEALLDEYDVTPEQLLQDLNELVTRLVEQGLLEVVDG